MTHAAAGNYALALAVVVSGGAALAAASAARYDSVRLLRAARWLIHTVTALLAACAAVLLTAILRNDFSLAYVVGYSERALPIGYKISALWAGHQGSLLLWAMLMAAAASAAVTLARKDSPRQAAPATGLLGVICGLFAMLLLFTSNPFELGKLVLPDGSGLNPMLQDPAMIVHPPLLFMGYAAATIPFAFALGALIAGRRDTDWIRPVRNWTMLSWMFLTIGIVLGAWWAYVELGWGGYWAWDPVENASLLPWLAATAALHSLIAHRRRGMMKVSGALLVPLTFILCLFATWLTRSGAISSVHAYSESGVGKFFLFILLACVAAAGGVILWRRELLRGQRHLERLLSREGGFTAGNALLVVILVTVLVGTLSPLLSKPFADKTVALDAKFYNTVVLPMAVALAILMGFAPMLQSGTNPSRLRGRLIFPAIALHVLAVLALLWGRRHGGDRAANVWMAVCAGAGTFVLAGIGQDILTGIRARWRSRHEPLPVAAAGSLWARRRRYGGFLAHLGMAAVVIAVAASSLYQVDKDLWLSPGQSEQVAGCNLRYDGLDQIAQANYLAGRATITLTKAGHDKPVLDVLNPQVRQYNKSEKRNTEVDLHSNLLEDVYVVLAGWEDRGDKAHIKVTVKPRVMWIWIGAGMMVAGAVVGLLPGPRKQPERPGQLTGIPATDRPETIAPAQPAVELAEARR